METFASELIDALGGTTKVADLMSAPVSTVQNMRVRHLTSSRLNHLLRIASDESVSIDLDALARKHGVELPQVLA